jgi:hypothetical protein
VVDHVSSRDRLILRATFWPRMMMLIGSVAFLSIGSAIWFMTREFTGFSFFSIALSGILLTSIIRSIGLILVLTPHSISQRGLLTHWEVKSHELKSWQLIRDTYSKAGYAKIVIRSETGEKSLSQWIVSGNRRYSQILNWLRTYYASKEEVA